MLANFSETIMDQTTQLVEQHIRASQSHLLHIDELMQRAAAARTNRAVPPEVEPRLAQFQNERNRFGQELDEVRAQSGLDASAVAPRAERLRGALSLMGAELEKTLLAIFARDDR